jgi:hypothetical protein
MIDIESVLLVQMKVVPKLGWFSLIGSTRRSYLGQYGCCFGQHFHAAVPIGRW